MALDLSELIIVSADKLSHVLVLLPGFGELAGSLIEARNLFSQLRMTVPQKLLEVLLALGANLPQLLLFHCVKVVDAR